MGKQKGAKAEKRKKNVLSAAARTSRKWTKDFYRNNRADDKPDDWKETGQNGSQTP